MKDTERQTDRDERLIQRCEGYDTVCKYNNEFMNLDLNYVKDYRLIRQ